MQNKQRPRGRKKIRPARFIPFLIITGIVIFTGIRICQYIIQSSRTRIDTAELETAFEVARSERVTIESAKDVLPVPAEAEPVPEESETAEESPAPGAYRVILDAPTDDMKDLYARNNDLVAWLRIPDVCSSPVVYRDNEYYLDHDFYGRKNVNGALFIDTITPFAENTPVLLIHGHNMHNGEMFGEVSRYIRKDYAAEHPYMSFSTIYGDEYYVLAGALVCDLNDISKPAYYHCALYNEELGWDHTFFREVWKNYALYTTGAGFDENDPLITLSTCLDGSKRLLVLFRRVRPEETREQTDALLFG